MEIKELLALYARHPQVRALSHALSDDSVRTLHMTGLQGSAAALTFAAANMPGDVADARRAPLLFILDDAEEAGYFYHDLVQLLGEEQVLFFPSSFRRAVKFGQRQRDPAYGGAGPADSHGCRIRSTYGGQLS